MLAVSQGFLDGIQLPLDLLSPLTFHCFYHAAVYYAGLKREDPSAMGAASALETIKSCMRMHQARWRSAGESFVHLFFYTNPQFHA